MRLLKSLTRGLDTLDYLVGQNGPARLTDVAVHLGVDKSNAAHILRTLVAAGYAEQVEGRKYQCSAKAQPKASQGLEEIIAYRAKLRRTLERLVELTGECAHMAVLVGIKVWYVDKIDSALPLKVDHPIGSLAPLYCTALGKAFLAFGEVKDPGPLEPHTPRTLTRKSALGAEIEIIRNRGYASDDEEFSQGIRCVAAPIYTPARKMIAAIGVSGPTARIDKARLSELGALVLEQAAVVTSGADHAL